MIIAITLISVFFLILGLIFRLLKPVNVLSGISAENVRDRDGLCRWFGNALTAFAVLYGLIAIGLDRFGVDASRASNTVTILVAFFLLGQCLVVTYVMGTGKFTRASEHPQDHPE